MNDKAYSLIEVMVAAAIVAVGLTAAAMLVGTLMRQQELNASSLRAANLQEQAIRLHRLDVPAASIPALLPEPSTAGNAPPAGGYAIEFSNLDTTNIVVNDTTVALEVTRCTMVYPNPVGDDSLVTNTLPVVRPSIRIRND